VNYWIRLLIVLGILFIGGLTAASHLEQTEYTARKIYLSGQQVFPERVLRRQLALKEKRRLRRSVVFTRRLLELDRLKLETYYIKQGFLNCVVSDSFAIRSGGLVDVYFRIHEGRQYFLESITVTGNQLFTTEQILKYVDHPFDRPFNPMVIRNGLDQIRTAYANHGKPLVVINDSLRVKEKIQLLIQIRENATMQIGDIKIINSQNVRDKPIRREITLQSGDIFSKTEVERSEKHIFETGLFSSVNIRLADIDTISNRLNLVVDVRELKMRYLGLDFGLGQDRGVSGGSEPYTSFELQGEWLHRNVFGRGSRLSASLKNSINLTSILTRPVTEAEVMYIEPWLWGFRSSTSFRLYLNNQVFTDQQKTEYGTEIAQLYKPDKRIFFQTGILINQIQYQFKSQNQTIRRLARERAVTLNYRRDFRDNFLYPTSGSMLTVYGKVVPIFLGGTQDYYKTEASYSQYWRLLGRVVLAYRVKIGWMDGLSRGAETPVYEKFYLGGSSSLRGWKERQLITRDDLPMGDDIKLLTNIEIRFPLFWLLGGELFLDGGNLAPDITSFRHAIYRWNTGFGVTIATPLGPVRIDYGKILNPLSDTEKKNSWQIQFAIPFAF